MSADTGRKTAFVFLLWLAAYVGFGLPAQHHDEAVAGLWIAFCGVILVLPASVDRSPKGEKPQALNAKHESATRQGDAQS